MVFTVKESSGRKSDMNVAPLIDVLLVLLITFMVITPLTPTGLDALAPQPPPLSEALMTENLSVVIESSTIRVLKLTAVRALPRTCRRALKTSSRPAGKRLLL
jgi:biopolymer transport protein ExbD